MPTHLLITLLTLSLLLVQWADVATAERIEPQYTATTDLSDAQESDETDVTARYSPSNHALSPHGLIPLVWLCYRAISRGVLSIRAPPIKLD